MHHNTIDTIATLHTLYQYMKLMPSTHPLQLVYTHIHTHLHSSTAALKEDIDSVLSRHQKMQDEIAEDMIRMAQSLKNNSLVAKEIILSDNKVRAIIHCVCVITELSNTQHMNMQLCIVSSAAVYYD